MKNEEQKPAATHESEPLYPLPSESMGLTDELLDQLAGAVPAEGWSCIAYTC